jgi:hypothetical protein
MDATKLGTYDYYFADVEDSKYGWGYGLLDVYTTPQYKLFDCDSIEASA